MQIRLYNNKSDTRTVNKSINLVKTINGQLMEGTTTEQPIIQIDYTDVNSINYARIDAFNRYYYIDNIEVVEGQHIIIHLRVDVLMSFYNSFKNSQCIAGRSSSNYNIYLEDKEVAKLPTSQFIYRRLATEFTPSDGAGNYVLTLGGKR